MSQSWEFGAASVAEFPAVLVEKMTRYRLLYAEMLDIISEMSHHSPEDRVGYSSLPAFLGQLLHLNTSDAGRMVKQAEQVAETVTPTGYVSPAPLPTVRAALHEGLLDPKHIEAVADAVARLPEWATLEHRELVETTLADTARTEAPRVVREQGRMLLDRIDQDGTDPHQEEKLAEPVNLFRSHRARGGGMTFSGQLDPEAADTLEALLGSLATPQPPAPGVPDPRSIERRRGDGMAAIIHLAANTGDAPTQGGAKPHATVTMDYRVLTEQVGTATLDDGSPLAPSAARRLACDADILPVVLNGERVPLDVGREHRLVQPKQRAALVTRDKGCAFPSCHLPARWTDAHHIKHWADGGKTDLNNMVLICRKHHRLVHHSEWSIHMINGIPWFKPPRWLDPTQKLVRNVLHC